jgi:hypothetical protein
MNDSSAKSAAFIGSQWFEIEKLVRWRIGEAN